MSHPSSSIQVLEEDTSDLMTTQQSNGRVRKEANKTTKALPCE
jgi:hypothetical protein